MSVEKLSELEWNTRCIDFRLQADSSNRAIIIKYFIARIQNIARQSISTFEEKAESGLYIFTEIVNTEAIALNRGGITLASNKEKR